MQRALRAVGFIFVFSSGLTSILLIVALGLSMASITIPSISIITPILLALISVVMAGPGAITGLAIALWVLGLVGTTLMYPSFFSSWYRSLFIERLDYTETQIADSSYLTQKKILPGKKVIPDIVRLSYTKAQIDASPYFTQKEILAGKETTPGLALGDFHRGVGLRGNTFRSGAENNSGDLTYPEQIKEEILKLTGESDIESGVSEIIYKTPMQHYGINLLIHEILRICKASNPKGTTRNSSERVCLVAEGGSHQWSWDKEDSKGMFWGIFCDIKQEFSSLSVETGGGASPSYYAYNIKSKNWEKLTDLYVLKERPNDFALIVSTFMRIRFPMVSWADGKKVISPYVEIFRSTNYFPAIVHLDPLPHSVSELRSSRSGGATASDESSSEEDRRVSCTR